MEIAKGENSAKLHKVQWKKNTWMAPFRCLSDVVFTDRRNPSISIMGQDPTRLLWQKRSRPPSTFNELKESATARTKNKMFLIPLHDILDVPVQSLTLVSDNPVSPARPVSMQKKRRHPRKQRSFSWGGREFRSNRWSSMSPQEDGNREQRVVRTKSFDGGIRRSKGHDSRWKSCPPSFFDDIPHKRSSPNEPPSSPIFNQQYRHGCQDKIVEAPSTPTQKPKSRLDSYNSPLRIPVRQPSREIIFHENESSSVNDSSSFPPKERLESLRESPTCSKNTNCHPLRIPIRQISRSLICQVTPLQGLE